MYRSCAVLNEELVGPGQNAAEGWAAFTGSAAMKFTTAYNAEDFGAVLAPADKLADCGAMTLTAAITRVANTRDKMTLRMVDMICVLLFAGYPAEC
jgi:hypothetical protein